MRICLLSDFQKTGGAAVAADRLAHSFIEHGHEVHRISSEDSHGITNGTILEHTLFLGRKHLLWDQLCTLGGKRNWADRSRAKEYCSQLNRLLQVIRPTFLNAHNLHGASWPFELIATCIANIPTIWTLHDCWSFLGAYYPTHSPTPKPDVETSLDSFWKKIDASGQGHALSAATPSEWMARQAKASKWQNRIVSPIPNAHPCKTLNPVPKVSARRTLGLPEDKRIILSVAGDLSEERKGGPMLAKILRKANKLNDEFIVVGNRPPNETREEGVRFIDFVLDIRLMAILYSAADLLLHTAPIDNLPNTVAESLRCGTPVAAFRAGGIPEMIEEKKTGWLVDEHKAEHMLALLADTPQLQSSVNDIQGFSEELFSEEIAVTSYISLFESLRR